MKKVMVMDGDNIWVRNDDEDEDIDEDSAADSNGI